jgi:hypothetical protein
MVKSSTETKMEQAAAVLRQQRPRQVEEKDLSVVLVERRVRLD